MPDPLTTILSVQLEINRVAPLQLTYDVVVKVNVQLGLWDRRGSGWKGDVSLWGGGEDESSDTKILQMPTAWVKVPGPNGVLHKIPAYQFPLKAVSSKQCFAFRATLNASVLDEDPGVDPIMHRALVDEVFALVTLRRGEHVFQRRSDFVKKAFDSPMG